MNKTPNVVLFHDTRRAKDNGKYPVKVRVTFNRITKYFPTTYDFTEEEYSKIINCEANRIEKIIGTKEYGLLQCELKKINNQLKRINDHIDNLHIFDFVSLNLSLKGKLDQPSPSITYDIYRTYEEKIKEYYATEKINTAISYECSLKSLRKFTDSKALHITAITTKFLERYEKWMTLENGNSVTTVGIYLRCLRAVFNQLKEVHKGLHIDYPFKSGKYVIPKKVNDKRALELDELKRIFEYRSTDLVEEEHLSYWKFIYMTNGFNVADMAELRYNQLSNEELRFVRVKTKNTVREVKEISAFYGDESKEIVRKFGNPTTQRGYIFPFYKEGMTELEKKKARANKVKQINKYIRRVAEKLDIPNFKDINTYVARHSFFSKFYGDTLDILNTKDLAGHSNIVTTELYIKSLRTSKKNEALKNITKF